MELLKCYEFNTQPRIGSVEVRHSDESVYVLTEFHRHVVSPLYEIIRKRYPEAYEPLCKRYQNSIANIWYFEFRVVCGFIKCNWGQFDNKWDIDENGDFHFEFCNYPLIGECESEGRICNPKEKIVLLESEIRVLRLIVAGQKSIEIADQLCLSPKTVENHQYNMQKRLGLHSNAALVDYWHRHKMK